ncbi:MAG: hypothetical protein IPK93_03310 [Solirubrobacterales bacterium]|nr:hypothetical protein [Solirubrobacterales bacterium]
MSLNERRSALLDDIARLRRVQLRVPEDRDVATVKANLEKELGETVSRRLAGRFLGVSHTALGKWIKSGDLPVVFNRKGRVEIPVSALLDLHEAVEAERSHGSRSRHLLEPAMIEGRERARRMTVDRTEPGSGDGFDGHGPAGRRGLAFHQVIAKRLTRRMVDEARQRVWTLRYAGKLDPRYADEWERVLGEPLDNIRQALVAEDQLSQDLRQNSPFAGMLSEPERRKILEATR